jgi:predicted CoA-binding protein
MATHPNFVESSAGLRSLLEKTRTIAVLGIKSVAQGSQAAYYVPQYLQSAGYEVIPVPVYYPQVTEILGRKVYRKLADIPQDVDLVNVFRRPSDIPPHLDDILAKQPRAVWLQLGIRNDAAAMKLAEAGIQVVQDRCIMVDHRTLLGPRR